MLESSKQVSFHERISFRRNHTTSIFFPGHLEWLNSGCPFVCVAIPPAITHKGGRTLPDYDISTSLLTRVFQTIYNRRNTDEKRDAMRV